MGQSLSMRSCSQIFTHQKNQQGLWFLNRLDFSTWETKCSSSSFPLDTGQEGIHRDATFLCSVAGRSRQVLMRWICEATSQFKVTWTEISKEAKWSTESHTNIHELECWITRILCSIPTQPCTLTSSLAGNWTKCLVLEQGRKHAGPVWFVCFIA